MKRSVTFIACVIVSMLVTSYMKLNTEAVTEAPIVPFEVEKIEQITEPQFKMTTYYDVPLNQEFQDYIRQECEASGIDIELVLAIMQIESGFNETVISETNDYGIMQINECNHERLKEILGITDFLDPYDSTKAGIYMLSQLSWCENESQMLMCYNMGTTGARRYWNEGIYESTYSRKVLQAKEEIGGKSYEVKILYDIDSKQ